LPVRTNSVFRAAAAAVLAKPFEAGIFRNPDLPLDNPLDK
jgi:hypothetical protein